MMFFDKKSKEKKMNFTEELKQVKKRIDRKQESFVELLNKQLNGKKIKLEIDDDSSE